MRPAGALLAFLSLLTLTAAPAAAQPRPREAPPTAPLALLVDQVLALFPKVEGEVIEVQGTSVTLSVGRRDGLQAGVEMELFREGRELRHPKTGEVLGRAETALGRVSVTQVFEAYAVGSVLQGAEARPGDRVRISSAKIRLALLPFQSGVKANLSEAVIHEVAESLNRSGRFQVGMGDQIRVWLAEQGIRAEEAIEGKGLEAAARRFKADNLLVLHLKRAEGRPYLEVRLYAFPGAGPLLSTALFVPPSIRPAPAAEFSAGAESSAPRPQARARSLLARLLGGEMEAGTYSSGESAIPLREVARFAFPVLSLDVAVSPQDRTPRLVLTDGERVFLYRLAGRALEPEWTYSAWAVGRIVSVQLADLDGDGVLEVVANRFHPDPSVGLHSFILTTRNGKPAVLAKDLALILLAVDASGEGLKKTLWGQPFTQNGFFARGQVEQYALRDGRLVRETRVRVPADFRATGATLSNIGGKGTRHLAYVGEQNRLQVAFEGEEVWRSAAPVGGGGHLRMELVKQDVRGGRSLFYHMEPVPLSVDLDGDGVEELVVPQNQVEGHLAVVFRGPAGYRLQSVNSGFEGTITALGTIPGENPPTLIAAVVRYTNLFKTAGETQIIMTTGE
jgi:hypothetical protein